MIAANVVTWKRSCVCFVDARLEAFGCQNEGNLDVYLPIRGMPDCYPGQLVGMESVGKGERVALCELCESPSYVVYLSNAKSSPSVGVCQDLLWQSNRIESRVHPSAHGCWFVGGDCCVGESPSLSPELVDTILTISSPPPPPPPPTPFWHVCWWWWGSVSGCIYNDHPLSPTGTGKGGDHGPPHFHCQSDRL